MITGTNHFFDRQSAYAYYREYGYSKTDVDEKFKNGEIKTGYPPVDAGQRAILNLKEMRYFVERI